MIKYVDLSISPEDFDKNYIPLIKECFLTGNFIGGSAVEEFEKNFANLCGVNYSVSLNSGTDALFLSLIALGIGEGDEVITVANSFMATANAIHIAGAKPIFVDIKSNMLIDENQIEKAITSKTKAILPVHLSGLICNMDKINQIAKKYNLSVIEDAAQSVGSKYKNSFSGSLGTVGCFSLHPLKNLSGIGDGGIVTTNDKNIYEKLLLLRNHGMLGRDIQEIVGFNSRLDTINAKILNYRINKVPQIISKRRENAQYYHQYLSEIDAVIVPKDDIDCYHSYHTFVIQTKYRDELKEYLYNKGVESKIHYPIPIIEQKPYKELGYKLPQTIKTCNSILSLPIGNVSKQEIKFIADIIRSYYYE